MICPSVSGQCGCALQLVQASSCASTHAGQISHKECVCLQLLVEKGADVNRPFSPESLPAIPFKHLVSQCPTALHLACDRGDIELVKVCPRIMSCYTALCCCSYVAVLPCASAVSDHAALLSSITKSVVGNHAGIYANDCALLCAQFMKEVSVLSERIYCWTPGHAASMLSYLCEQHVSI